MKKQYIDSDKNSTSVLNMVVSTIVWALWRVAPGPVCRLILRFFFKPDSVSQRPEEIAMWERGTPFSLRVHNRIVRGRYWGEGPGVLLVHGWNGRGSQFHAFVKPIVSAGYRAIAFDGPAHGESDGNYTSYFEFTEVIRALLGTEAGMDIEKIVAHSFGAGAVVNAVTKENLTLDLAFIAPALKFEEFMHQSFQRLGIPYSVFKDLIGRFETEFGYDLHLDNPQRLLRLLKSPLLIVHDAGDKAVPYESSAESAEQFPNIVLHTTNGLGHTRILSELEATSLVLAHLFEIKPKACNF